MFTLFSTIWSTIRTIITISDTAGVTWESLKNNTGFAIGIVTSVNNVSTFWVNYLLQRNLGSLLDIIQVVSLISQNFYRYFMSPTPRQMIEWTAPPVFDYANYYNYFLFYSTIALVFATVQPLVLPIAFLYFLVDSFLKKYCLMYIFVTKVESNGAFWRVRLSSFLFHQFYTRLTMR